MELNGVTIDSEVLARLRGQLTDKANDFAAQAYAQIGHEINLGSPKQLQQVLFEELGMPKTRATKTGYSTDAGSRRRPAGEEPASVPRPCCCSTATRPSSSRSSRRWSARREGWPHPHDDDRHGRTGRISSNDPNLQNIPIRTEEGRGSRLHAGRGASRRCSPPTTRRSRCGSAGPPVGGPGADRGVQRRGGPAPLLVGSRVFGAALPPR
ncbi:DNA polymerase [Sinomonas atrocyanea]